MRTRSFRKVVLVTGLFCIALLALAPSALADFQGPYECQNWSMTILNGPLDLAINPDAGPSPFLEFSYSAPLPYNYDYRKAALSAVASRTGTVSFDWEYNFFHSWFSVYADLWVYADGPSGRTEQHLVDFYQWGYTGPKTFTGSVSIDLTEGYEFGLIVGGSNFDRAQILEGTVTLTNFFFPVLIDIKPGSCPSSINLKNKGVTPVAIVGTENFDPVAEVDVATVELAGVSPVSWDIVDSTEPYKSIDSEPCYNCFDADDPKNFNCDLDGDGLNDAYCGDGFDDLILYFETPELSDFIEDDGCIPLTLEGAMIDGTPFEGTDIARIK